MKRNIVKKMCNIIGIMILLGILIFIIMGMYQFYRSLTSIDGIKGEECIGRLRSPDGKYEVQAFRNNGGATTDYAVLVVLIDLVTAEEKNIYWQYHCEEANMVWQSNTSIKINDIILQVPDQIYDYRKYKDK